MTPTDRGSAGTLGRDVVAGLTVWAILVPESLAYATIAGVPPVVGLYAAPAALLLYAVLGSSRHLVVGPMAAVAALSAAAIASLTTDPSTAIALTAALAILVGVFGLLAGLARLGFLASFISEPVLKGFIIGLALTIIAGQLPKLFGLERVSGNFFERIAELLGSLDDLQVAALAVGGTSLAVLLILRRLFARVPASLLVVAGAIVSARVFDLEGRGVEVVGPISAGLPPVGLPEVTLSDYLTLAASAAGILLVAFAEGLGGAKAYAARSGDQIDPNRELLGVGAANLGAGLSAGMAVSGSLSKTAVNVAAGARTQRSGIVAAVLTVLTLLFLTGLFEQLPEATLAAVVIAAVIELVDLSPLRRLHGLHSASLERIYGHATRADLIAAVAALAGVLIFDTLPGLFIGIGVSAVLLAYRASRPHVAVLGRSDAEGRWIDLERGGPARPAPRVQVLRPEASLSYINADSVRQAVLAMVDDAAAEELHAIILDLEVVGSIDATAGEMLVQLEADLDRRGIRLVVCGAIGQVRDLLTALGAGHLVDGAPAHVDAAVAAARAPRPGERPPPCS